MNDPSDYPKEEREKIRLDIIRIMSISIFFLIVGLLMFFYSYYTNEETHLLEDFYLYMRIFCFFIMLVGIFLIYYKENIFLHTKLNALKVPKDFKKYRGIIIFVGVVLVIIGLLLIIWFYAIPYISKYYLINNN
jgi:magnesium-transporting ATPase (P-type)